MQIASGASTVLAQRRRLIHALWLVLGFAVVLGSAVYATSLARGETVLQALRSSSLLQMRALVRPVAMDSWSPMWSGRYRMLESDESPHLRTLRLDHCKYQYPPSSLLLLEVLPPPPRLPLDCSGDLAAQSFATHGAWPAKPWIDVLSAAATLGVIALGLVLLRRSLAGWSTRQALPVMVLAAVLGLTFYPLLQGHRLGQVQIFLNLALGVALLTLSRWPLASGALVGLCCLFKPHYALFAAWGALRGRWRWLAGLLAAFGVGSLLALAVYGLAPHRQYLDFLSQIAKVGEVYWSNQSLNGVLNRLFDTGDPALWDPSVFPSDHPVVRWGTQAGSAVVLLLALARRRQMRDERLDFGAMLAALTLASPIAWEHHYGGLLPVFALLLGRQASAAAPRGAWMALGGAWVLMSNAVVRPDWLLALPAGEWLMNHLWGGALLLFALLLRWREQAPGGTALPKDNAGLDAGPAQGLADHPRATA